MPINKLFFINFVDMRTVLRGIKKEGWDIDMFISKTMSLLETTQQGKEKTSFLQKMSLFNKYDAALSQ